ncbi:MAG: hypothetical protein WCR52_11225 [Bacteroidota bacterium]
MIQAASFFNQRRLLFCLCFLGGFKPLYGQIIYAFTFNDQSQQFVYAINLSTCEACPVTPAISLPFGVLDLVMLPNGNHLYVGGNTLARLESPPGVGVVWTNTNPAYYWYCGELAPSGLVYLGGSEGLGVFNPAGNTVSFIGPWPSSISYMQDLFYVNGDLYGIGYDFNTNTNYLVLINVANPAQSTIVNSISSPYGGVVAGNWNGNSGLFHSINTSAGISDIYFYNLQTNTDDLICDLPNNLFFYNFSYLPPNIPNYTCLSGCTTNAGTITPQSPTNYCINASITVPHNNNATLDNNDLLQYVLFSNPSDTAGSIIATSNTPTFTFAPPMQTGVTYYVAAMAGNNAGGNVNLADPCLDFSNANPIVWRPLPSVAFSAGNQNVCPGGCKSITANFTGTAPFSLTYNATGSGSVTQVFPGSSGVFQVCIPANTGPGGWTIQATSLSDARCTCQ